MQALARAMHGTFTHPSPWSSTCTGLIPFSSFLLTISLFPGNQRKQTKQPSLFLLSTYIFFLRTWLYCTFNLVSPKSTEPAPQSPASSRAKGRCFVFLHAHTRNAGHQRHKLPLANCCHQTSTWKPPIHRSFSLLSVVYCCPSPKLSIRSNLTKLLQAAAEIRVPDDSGH